MTGLRVGILGAGLMGQAHAQAYREAGIHLTGIADINQATATNLATRFDCEVFTSAEDLLSAGIDAVSICLPHSLHKEAALLAASQGKHILMEKPLAITLEEAETIVAACRSAKVRLMVGFIQRFLATLQELRALIVAGTFGEIGLVVDYLAAGGPWPVLPPWYLQRAIAGGGILMIGQRPSEKIFLLFFAILVLLHSLAVSSARLLPFTDLPNHLAASTIVRHYSDFGNEFSKYFSVDLFPKPNVLHILFCSLKIFPSVEAANSAWYFIYALMLPLSALLLQTLLWTL